MLSGAEERDRETRRRTLQFRQRSQPIPCFDRLVAKSSGEGRFAQLNIRKVSSCHLRKSNI